MQLQFQKFCSGEMQYVIYIARKFEYCAMILNVNVDYMLLNKTLLIISIKWKSKILAQDLIIDFISSSFFTSHQQQLHILWQILPINLYTNQTLKLVLLIITLGNSLFWVLQSKVLKCQNLRWKSMDIVVVKTKIFYIIVIGVKMSYSYF